MTGPASTSINIEDEASSTELGIAPPADYEPIPSVEAYPILVNSGGIWAGYYKRLGYSRSSKVER